MDYIVKKINIKDDYVKIVVESSITISNFVIRVNDFLDLGVRLNEEINDLMMDKLTKLHIKCFAYKKCLNKLVNKDYSVNEIKELLNSFKIQQVDELIFEFKQAGLLDDEKLVKNYFDIGQMKRIGKKKLYVDLKQRKVSEELINHYYHLVNDDIEIENGIYNAKKYFGSYKELSLKQAIAKVRIRLIENGYQDNIESIMNRSNFQRNEENEYNNLVKAYKKVLRQYINKYRGATLRQHLFNSLYSKGYQTSLINKVLEGEQE